MRLDLCEIRPGKVLQVIDNYGHIKASCTGIFSEQDDPDLLPPMSQFFKISSTQYSQPHIGDDIYVFIFSDNPQLFLYVFRGDVAMNNGSELDNEYDDAEILMKRHTDAGDVRVGYDSDNGYDISVNESNMNIGNDSNIHLNHKDGNSISITDNGISLGKDGGSSYSAVCGEELVKVLKDIKSLLNTIKTSAAGNPQTAHISTAMTSQLATLSNFDKILSKIVTLQKE